MMNSPNEEYSIVPSTGIESTNFNMQSDGAIPASFSAGGWTYGNEGFAQQTFVGASIMDFSVNGGFGTSSSSLNVNLVNDEYNVSDKHGLGQGDDVYHNGKSDLFRPPQVGSPVFFKFGKHHCSVDEAWRPTYDKIYNYKTISPNARPVEKHIGRSGIPNVNTIDNTKNTDGGPIEIVYSGIKGTDPAVLYDSTDDKNTYVDKSKVLAPKNRARGIDHFIFGGILQSYTQNRGGDGNPVFSASVTDPREILSNVVLLLDNYSGTTFNNPNLLNLYGFLEHNPTDTLFEFLKASYDNQVTPNGNPHFAPSTVRPITRMGVDRNRLVTQPYLFGGHLRKIVNDNIDTTPLNESTNRPLPLFQTGAVRYEGNDMWAKAGIDTRITAPHNLPPEFPITGVGMARRNDEGIPFYRVAQAVRAVFNYDGETPDEYIAAGYGGAINFRGFNYVVDLSGFPAGKIPPYYRLNFDKMTLMELCQELADVISHDLYVTLMPVLDHPATSFIYTYNENLKITKPNWKDLIITGVIRVDVIDRSKKPEYGAIQKFINQQTELGESVQNNDIGYELSNVTTDKFVVGGQESKLYFFSSNRDRDSLDVRKFKSGRSATGTVGDAGAFNAVGDQWKHWKSLQQQILPFYGFLGKDAVTIPRGWGAYQQIQLDATSLNAAGVGNYYIATELELRAASVSYDRWKDFLIRYNEEYMHSMEEDDALERTLLQKTPAIPSENQMHATVMDKGVSSNYGVSVPRCVFTSDKNYFTQNGLPASPCSPPLGYPLYYKRATQVGIPEAGITRIHNSLTNMVTSINKLKAERNDADQDIQNAEHEMERINSEIQFFLASQQPVNDPAAETDEESRNVQKTDTDTKGKPSSFGDKLTQLFFDELDKYQKKYLQVEKLRAETGYDATTGQLATGVARKDAIEHQIGLLKAAVTGKKDLFTKISKLHKKAVSNSKKVHEFLKGIADKHLGKTFLVKIPKDTNVYYRDGISFADYGSKTNYVGQVTTGPFGFRPEPIDAETPNQYFTQAFQNQLRSSMINGSPPQPFDYLRGRTVDKVNLLSVGNQGVTIPERRVDYSDGALKCNFDQVDDTWMFNYEVDTNGGWFDYQMCPKPIRYENIQNIIDRNLGINKLPYVTQNILFPKDMYNFIEKDGRVKAYVRYNHSQHLNFHGVPKDKMTQQRITFNSQLVPVLLDELDNMLPDKFVSLKAKNQNAPEMTAFVKVDVDSKLYMAPRVTPFVNTPVFGTEVMDIGGHVLPTPILDPVTCKFALSYGFYQPIYVPHPKKGGYGGVNIDHVDFQRTFIPELNGDIINTEPHSLDPDAVYALITVPGRVKPTIDSRMQDGPNQLHGTQDMKSMLTQDVVKNFHGFEKPTMRGKPKGVVGDICNQLSAVSLNEAINASKAVMKGTMLDDPYRKLGMTTESPVFPDIVALPLQSKERCYGPWISSALAGQQVRYKNIGGKVDFKKDDKITPWNFGGYDLMNQAGVLEAQFSNSLLLFSERGGIVFAGAPKGSTLCQALVNGGPLVTSISVSVGQGGVSTTYKMDLYTSRFGKLDQQKRGELDKASRERQKVMDTRNKRVRMGLDKSASQLDFGMSYQQYGNIVDLSSSTGAFIGALEESAKPSTNMIVASVNNSPSDGAYAGSAPVQSASQASNFNMSSQGSVTSAAAPTAATTQEQSSFSTSVMNSTQFTSNGSVYPDADEFNTAFYNSAGGDLSQNMVPMSEDAYHPNMPNKERRKSNSALYGLDNIQPVLSPVPGLPQAGAASHSDAPASAGMLGGQSGKGGSNASVPSDIIGQVDAATLGVVGALAEMAAWGSMGLGGLSAGMNSGWSKAKNSVDDLNDLFGNP
jgi:hypothetical protein